MTMESKNHRVRGAIRGALKVSLSVVLVVLVGYGVAIFGPDGEVAEAEADIFDLFHGPRNSTAQFVRSLDRLGHDAPQTYDLNGNTIHFSVNYLEHSPRDVVTIYQREFHRSGMNKKMFTDLRESEAHERHLQAVTGGIVPIAIDDGHVVMGGMITKGNPQNFEDMLRVYDPSMVERELFKGHRYIEAFREPGTNLTTIISTWSDEGFDYGKMFPNAYNVRDFSVDLRVPSCPGCERINRFADLNADPSPYEKNIYTSTFSREQINEFYRQAMVSRGWEQEEDTSSVDRIMWFAVDEGIAEKLQFTKGEKLLTILVNQDPGDLTYVQTMMTRDRPSEVQTRVRNK